MPCRFTGSDRIECQFVSVDCGTAPDGRFQRAYRVRTALFLVCVVLVVCLLGTVYQGIQTLARLNVVERERDRWQRPSEVIQALSLSEGSSVADIGSGAGYFALKLSSAVGKNGAVLAVDTRRLPLLFLWIRALLRRSHNLQVIHGEADNPHLPLTVSAVLVANTYHELAHPKSILDGVFRTLIPGGRLVIVDRGPHSAGGGSRETETQHHELPPALVESELRQQGFEIVSRQDRFIDRPGELPWWLIVARKP